MSVRDRWWLADSSNPVLADRRTLPFDSRPTPGGEPNVWYPAGFARKRTVAKPPQAVIGLARWYLAFLMAPARNVPSCGAC
jgi:hypothetical protein